MLRKWWREWGLIDLIALGTGFCLTVGYALYRSSHSTADTPILDLWPNIATEIVGVWLSVRIIDAMINRRTSRHNNRQGIVRNMIYFLEIAQTIVPYFDDWKLRNLQNELSWFEERLPKRQKYLSEDELLDVRRAISLGKEVQSKALRYQELKRSIEDSHQLIQSVLNIREKSDDTPRIYLYELGWFEALEQEYRKFTSRHEFNREKIDQVVANFQQSVQALPPELTPHFENYLTFVQNTVALRSEFDEQVLKLENQVLRVKDNIFEESDPDY